MYVEFDVVLEEGESGYWIASVPSLPGCLSQGTTKSEALEHVREAIELMLEDVAPKAVEVAKVTIG